MPAILDIVEEVLQCLAEDTKALRKCSLVCKAWISPSQRLIFHKFVFTIVLDRKYQRYTKQATILANSPHLAAYVQHVYISIGSAESGRPLVPLLQRLTNVRSFTFTSFSAAQWGHLPKELQYVIQNITASRTFVKLDLTRWVFEPQQLNNLLGNCSSTLRSLGLRSLDIRSSGKRAETEPVELVGLKEIYVHNSSSFPAHGTLKTPSVDFVERLLHSGCDAAQCLPLLTPGIPSSVSMWSFYIPLSECMENKGCSAINFHDLDNLRHLRIAIECRLPPIDPVPPLHRTSSISALGRMLLRVPTAHLRYIDIDFLCRYERLPWVQDDWDHMAASLEPLLNASESLEKLTFVLDAAGEQYAMIFGAIKKRFEDLKSRPVLQAWLEVSEEISEDTTKSLGHGNPNRVYGFGSNHLIRSLIVADEYIPFSFG
ncbi:F-box domain-containing protein [Pleurotus pulmonarius]